MGSLRKRIATDRKEIGEAYSSYVCQVKAPSHVASRFAKARKPVKIIIVLLIFAFSGLIVEETYACFRGRQGFIRRVAARMHHRRQHRIARRQARRGYVCVAANTVTPVQQPPTTPPDPPTLWPTPERNPSPQRPATPVPETSTPDPETKRPATPTHQPTPSPPDFKPEDFPETPQLSPPPVPSVEPDVEPDPPAGRPETESAAPANKDPFEVTGVVLVELVPGFDDPPHELADAAIVLTPKERAFLQKIKDGWKYTPFGAATEAVRFLADVPPPPPGNIFANAK